MHSTTWNLLFKDCDTLEAFNERVVPAMKAEGDPFKTFAAQEAKRRGYRPDKLLGIYVAPVEMKLTKGRNVIKVGYSQDTLHVEFANGAQWEYAEVPQEEYFKLLRSPYPDRIFASNVREKFKAKKKAPSG